MAVDMKAWYHTHSTTKPGEWIGYQIIQGEGGGNWQAACVLSPSLVRQTKISEQGILVFFWGKNKRGDALLQTEGPKVQLWIWYAAKVV